jgi:hypothetical protein
VVKDAHESMTSCDESRSHRACGLVGGPCVQSGILDEVYCSEQAQDSCLIASYKLMYTKLMIMTYR